MAAKRFNQAYLLDPNESALFHGFAIVVFERFGDDEYADELLRVAARANSPEPTLSGDHGMMLLRAGRVQEAIPLLEKGMRDLPEWYVPRINLALAHLELGNRQRACELMDEIPPEDVASVADGIALVRNRGNC
jgi:Flp pilus assembly protein TadD